MKLLVVLVLLVGVCWGKPRVGKHLKGVFSHTGNQKYSIKVKLMCGSAPAADHQVKLVDNDWGIDPDDELDEGRTNSNGEIELSGATFEGGSIDPRVEIYTDCRDGFKPCQRKWKINLPDKYINAGVMDLGTLNLEMKLKDEDRDCIH